MKSHEKALEKAKKHAHKRGSDGKCEICNMVMKGDKDLDEKNKKADSEYSFLKYQGAKNNASDHD